MATTLGSKAQAFARDAEEAGWKVQTWKDDDGITDVVTATNGGSGQSRKTIFLVWVGEKYSYEDSYQSTGDDKTPGKSKTIRNASEARRIISQASGINIETKKVPRKGQETKPTRDFEAEARRVMPEKKRLPFKTSSPDRKILESVVGKTIRWWNAKARHEEVASVLADPDQRQLRIEWTRDKKRVLTFAAKDGGFRSVYLDRILEVSK